MKKMSERERERGGAFSDKTATTQLSNNGKERHRQIRCMYKL